MEERSSAGERVTGEISLREILLKVREWSHYLISKWLIILFFCLSGSLLGFVYACAMRPQYTAITTFVLEESGQSGGLGQYAGLASMVGMDMGGGGGIFQGDNILELYKSRSMIEKALLSNTSYLGTNVLLIERYIDFNKLRKQWAKNPALCAIHFSVPNPHSVLSGFDRLQDSVLGIIVTDINKNYLSVIKPDKKLSLIQAEVKAPDEFFAKAFNEQIVKTVNDFYIQTRTKKSMQNIAILENKTDSVRRVLNGEIYSAAAASDATPNLNITHGSQRTAPMQRSQFSAETNKAILAELVKNMEMSKISLLKETPLIQVIDKPVFPLETIRFSKSKGMVVGFLIGLFLSMVILLTGKIYQEILQ